MRVFSALAAAAAVAAQLPADEWSQAYRGWTYYEDWVIPPSCPDPATCAPPYINISGAFSDCMQVWSTADPNAPNPPSPRYVASYIFYDGVGYQSAWAMSDDLVHFTQLLAPQGILYSPRTSWDSVPGQFDYGGTAFIGPVMDDYNVTAPRVLKKVGSPPRFWYAYFAQDRRGEMEPPPGASGLASSDDGFLWRRELNSPFLDTDPAHGAQQWEQTQIYAPYLVLLPNGTLVDFYNAQAAPNPPWREQSGIATLLDVNDLPGVNASTNASSWQRYPGNPVIANGNTSDAGMASDPKVYFDASLGESGAWVMLYFGLGTEAPYNGHACIEIAFSLDLVSWTKASTPLYQAGGHPRGYDKCHAHKAWLNADATGRKYLYYTGDGCDGRGILLLTSTPLP
jgi:hypothetical protein